MADDTKHKVIAVEGGEPVLKPLEIPKADPALVQPIQPLQHLQPSQPLPATTTEQEDITRQGQRNIPRGQTPKRAAYMKEYNATHPKRDRRAYKKAYDEAHKEEITAYRISMGDELLAKKREYYKKNRERILANVKLHSIKNKESILEYQAKYYKENLEKVKANVSAYRAANPEKKMHLENKRRARKFENGGSHTLEDLLEKFESLGNACFYCGKSGALTIDHDIPLSRGGTDNIENILPACRSCNSKKNAKTSEEYVKILSNSACKN